MSGKPSSNRSSKKKSDAYFNFYPYVWQALRSADEKYPLCFKLSKNKITQHQEYIENVWRKPGLETPISWQIGIRGKIWALCALLPRLNEKNAPKPSLNQLAIDIWGHNSDRKASATEIQIGSRLITEGEQRDVECLDKTRKFYLKVVDFFAFRIINSDLILANDELSKEQALSKAILSAQSLPAISPSESLNHVLHALGLQNQIFVGIPPMHRLEQSFEQYMNVPENFGPKPSQEVESLVKWTHSQLRGPTRTVMIKGQRNAGKKSVIGDLLRLLSEAGDPSGDPSIKLALRNSPGAPKLHLPVFAVSIPMRSYLRLSIDVLVFLKCLNDNRRFESPQDFDDAAKSLIHQYARTGTVADLADILAEIEHLNSQHPAFFIFSDVDGLEMDSLSRYLDRQGINRLYDALRRSHSDNRFFLTGSQKLNVAGMESSDFYLTEMPLPTIDRLAWYLSSNQRKSFELFKKSVRYNPKLQAKSINGEILLALAMIYPDSEEIEAYGHRVLEKGSVSPPPPASIIEFFQHAQEVINNYDSPGCARCATEQISVILIQQLKGLKILRAIACIAASDDGVSPSSLEWMLEEWNRNHPEDSIAPGEVLQVLKLLTRKANNLGVSLRNITYSDKREYSCDEPIAANTWRMNNSLSRSMVQTLQNSTDPEDSLLIRHAFRLVAMAARRRAQLLRVRGKSFDPAEAGYSGARDIQCLVALLASFEPNVEFDKRVLLNCSIPLNSHRIYVLDSAAFSPEITLTHVVKDLLQRSIDRDFRLTMASDQDALRLRLYLLLFMPLGYSHYWSVGEFREGGEASAIGLPSQIPRHLANIFSTEEIFELLTTISLSAYHCQLPAVVSWAKQIATDLIASNPDQFTTNGGSIARILCSYIDASIGFGRPLQLKISAAEGNLLGVLDECQNFIKEFFESIDSSGDAKSFLESAGSVSNCRGWMRLRAREAELSWIATGDASTASRIYKELSETEEKLRQVSDRYYPTIFSGRTARRYLRFMTKDHAIYSLGQDTEKHRAVDFNHDINAVIKNLIELNIARLERFSGAERIGVLLDLARRRNFIGETEAACKYVDEARPYVYSGAISHSGRVEWLTLSLALTLSRLESAKNQSDRGFDEETQTLLPEVSDLAHNIVETATYLDFRPTVIIGKFLIARAKYLLITGDNSQTIELPYSEYTPAQLLREAVEEASSQSMTFASQQMSQIEKKLLTPDSTITVD